MKDEPVYLPATNQELLANEQDFAGNDMYPIPSGLFGLFDIAMRRPRHDWDYLSQDREGTRLQFGGGKKRIEGYSSIDYPLWNAESMEPIWYADNSVDEVVCLHTLDHLSAAAVQYWLADMQRILKPGGKITIVVPHHMSTLAEECIEHKTRYGLKTWRNILANPSYEIVDTHEKIEWRLKIGFNMIMGLEERNLVLVTQLVKE